MSSKALTKRLLDSKSPIYNVLEADVPAHFQTTDYLCKVLKSQLKKQDTGVHGTFFEQAIPYIYHTHTFISIYVCT